MRKNILKLMFIMMSLSLLVVSCDNLERFPANAIERGQSFETMADATAWNNGLYNRLRGNLYGSRMFNKDLQADQLNASTTYGNRNGATHSWVEFLPNTGILQTTWLGGYRGIAEANTAINNFGKITTESAADVAELDRYLGDAHFVRAYFYFDLVVRFAKMYDPATAATDLGVPIYLTFDVTVAEARNTVEQVYQQILDDIAVAKQKLASYGGASGSVRFNVDIVKALEARVRFYKQDFVEAKALSDELIASGKYPLTTTAAGLKSMWHTDMHQEVIGALFVGQPQEAPNTNNIYLGLQPATGFFAPDFIPSQWVVDMYDKVDYRRNVYFEQKIVSQSNIEYPDIWLVNKYPGNPALFTGVNTNYAHTPILFRIAEMYLISAESALSIPGGDVFTSLNALRVARNLPALTGLAGAALTTAVQDERFKELAFEGFRLDDLRRWKLGFTRRLPQNVNLINTGVKFDVLSRAAGHGKFTWGIPTLEITANPNIVDQQNPGW